MVINRHGAKGGRENHRDTAGDTFPITDIKNYEQVKISWIDLRPILRFDGPKAGQMSEKGRPGRIAANDRHRLPYSAQSMIHRQGRADRVRVGVRMKVEENV